MCPSTEKSPLLNELLLQRRKSLSEWIMVCTNFSPELGRCIIMCPSTEKSPPLLFRILTFFASAFHFYFIDSQWNLTFSFSIVLFSKFLWLLPNQWNLTFSFSIVLFSKFLWLLPFKNLTFYWNDFICGANLNCWVWFNVLTVDMLYAMMSWKMYCFRIFTI